MTIPRTLPSSRFRAVLELLHVLAPCLLVSHGISGCSISEHKEKLRAITKRYETPPDAGLRIHALSNGSADASKPETFLGQDSGARPFEAGLGEQSTSLKIQSFSVDDTLAHPEAGTAVTLTATTTEAADELTALRLEPPAVDAGSGQTNGAGSRDASVRSCPVITAEGKRCGAECEPCNEGEPCKDAADCESGACSPMSICLSPSCKDSVTNGTESGVDCGGECSPCGAGQPCFTAADCQDGQHCNPRADAGRSCAPITCLDTRQNGDESSIDCGGTQCTPCEVGRACREDADCLSVACEASRCQVAACDDGRENGAETSADCGGAACDPCSAGFSCRNARDCLSGNCDELCLAAGKDGQCRTDTDCLSLRCKPANVCDASRQDEACSEDSDCHSRACRAGQCIAGFSGAPCEKDRECQSDQCKEDKCQPADIDAQCRSAADCISSVCDSTCKPMELQIESNGTPDAPNVVQIKLWIGPGNATIDWNEIALFYFFTPEASGDLIKNYEEHAIEVGPIKFVQLTESQWAYIWRSPETTPISRVTASNYQIHDSSWQDFDSSNDHSFREGRGVNNNIVVCRNTGDRWVHTQGRPPAGVSQPCAYVDSCANVRCDEP